MFKYVINEQRQLDFAKLSNDFNPIHVDPLYAWRSMFGKQLVHGIHQVLICLEDLAKNINEKYLYLKSLLNLNLLQGSMKLYVLII